MEIEKDNKLAFSDVVRSFWRINYKYLSKRIFHSAIDKLQYCQKEV